MSKLISIIINADSRIQRNSIENTFEGVCNEDFLVDGVLNKIKFFKGFDIEIILHIDKHLDVSRETLDKLQEICDIVLIRKHTNEHSFNDWNYIRGLQLAIGDILVHFDQDCAAFADSKETIQELINLLNKYTFISYPSKDSPVAVKDDSFNHIWCSTRFFMCKKENLDLLEISKCLSDYDYWCKTYPVNRKCHWFEHLAGSIAKYRNQSIYYLPINMSKYMIFCWSKYVGGVLKSMNNWNYNDAVEYINNCSGINYPCDVEAKTGII